MNPNDLKQILDALTYADVREFSLRTGSFDLSLKRGPQAFAAPTPMAGPAPLAAPVRTAEAETELQASGAN